MGEFTTTIPELTEALTVGNNDLLLIDQEGEGKKVKFSTLLNNTVTSSSVAAIGGSFRDEWIEGITTGLDISLLHAGFNEDNNLTFDLSGEVGTVTNIPETFNTDGILEINGITKYLRRRDPVVSAERFVESYAIGVNAQDPDLDWGPILRYAFKDISASGKRTKLKFGTPIYKIKTAQPSGDIPSGNPAFGKNVALWIERAELVCIEGNYSTIRIEGDTPAVQNLDDVICVARGDVDEQPFVNWHNLTIDGGAWTDISKEPQYLIRADYNVVKYSSFNNIRGNRCVESNIKMCGFNLEFNHCDMRRAQTRANYELVGVSGLGSGGTRTSFKFDHCVADYAGLYGFSVSGASGTTYCTWITCAADHIGRDRSNNTITANNAFAASYYGSALFSADFINCGSEFSTRAFRLNTAKGVGLTRCYTNGNGTTNGTTIDGQIIVGGFTEQLEIKGFRSGNLTNTTYDLVITNPVTLNNNSITIDDSIPNNRISFTGTKSSTNSIITRLADYYREGMRRPSGGAVVAGKPLAGNVDVNFFNQNAYTHDFDFFITTAGGGAPKLYEVLELTNQANQGALYVVLDVMAGKSLAQVPTPPQRLQGKAAVNTGNFTPSVETQLIPIDGTASSFAGIVYYWSGNILRIKITEQFMSGSVRVSVVGRPEGSTMTYTPLGVVF